MMDKERKKLLPCAAGHRLDEPAKRSLGMVASPQFPPLFHLARLIVAPPSAAVPNSPPFRPNEIGSDV